MRIIKATVEKVEDLEKSYFLPRAIAYLVDILLVGILCAVIISFIPANKNYDKYMEEFKQVQDDFIKDKNVKKYMDKSVPIVYDIDYSNCASMFVKVTVLLLYFVVFQAYNKGQTVGKKLLKIKIVSTDGNELTVNQIAIRGIIIDSIFINLLIIGALLFSNRDVYYYISLGLQGFEGLLVVVSLIMILFRKDGRGLHDVLAKTQVVSC